MEKDADSKKITYDHYSVHFKNSKDETGAVDTATANAFSDKYHDWRDGLSKEAQLEFLAAGGGGVESGLRRVKLIATEKGIGLMLRELADTGVTHAIGSHANVINAEPAARKPGEPPPIPTSAYKAAHAAVARAPQPPAQKPLGLSFKKPPAPPRPKHRDSSPSLPPAKH